MKYYVVLSDLKWEGPLTPAHCLVYGLLEINRSKLLAGAWFKEDKQKAISHIESLDKKPHTAHCLFEFSIDADEHHDIVFPIAPAAMTNLRLYKSAGKTPSAPRAWRATPVLNSSRQLALGKDNEAFDISSC